jgi:hypothetical protein
MKNAFLNQYKKQMAKLLFAGAFALFGFSNHAIAQSRDPYISISIDNVDYLSLGASGSLKDSNLKAQYSVGAKKGQFEISNLPVHPATYGEVRIDFPALGSDDLRDDCLKLIIAKQQAQLLSSINPKADKYKLKFNGVARYSLVKAFKPALLEITFIPMEGCGLL